MTLSVSKCTPLSCVLNSLTVRPVGRAVMRSSLEREVWGSNLRPVKSNTVLPMVRHRCNISLKGAVQPGRNDVAMGPTNSLHASAYYSDCNERFSSLHWKITFQKKLMLQECKGILKHVASNGEVGNLRTTISCVQLKRFKSLNFGSPIGGDSHFGTPKFCLILSFLYIYLP